MTKIVSLRATSSIFLLAAATSTLIGLTSCRSVATDNSILIETANPKQVTLSPAVQMVTGDYVSTGYDERAQGYDWVAVIVEPYGKDQIDIKVRARSDIKKPTCTFDAKATLMGQDKAHGAIFQTPVNNSMAFFQFKDDTLTIDSQDKYALNYFCSGGGSLVGNYEKLEGDLELN